LQKVSKGMLSLLVSLALYISLCRYLKLPLMPNLNMLPPRTSIAASDIQWHSS